jgi:hypothetical protein
MRAFQPRFINTDGKRISQYVELIAPFIVARACNPGIIIVLLTILFPVCLQEKGMVK